MTPQQLNGQAIDFPLRKKVMISIQATPLEKGKHELEMTFQTSPFGKLNFSVDDSISEKVEITRILRSKDDDYGELVINERQRFVERFSPAKLENIPRYSFDPHMTSGNIENFTGVAQIPLGFAGPLQVNGEHAQGEFIIPQATTKRRWWHRTIYPLGRAMSSMGGIGTR